MADPGQRSRGRRPAAPGPPREQPDRPCPPRPADVLLDLVFADGLLFLVLENLGDLPAHGVRVRFRQPLRGHGGTRRIDRLRIFRRLELLGPGRRIPVFLDRAALFFARDDPTAFEAIVTWRGDDGRRGTRAVGHDVDAYRDYPYLEVPDHA